MGLLQRMRAGIKRRLYEKLHKVANRIHPTNASGNNTSKM